MSVLVAGTFRVPPANIQALNPHMATVVAASRAEDGCLEYSYAVDIEDPGLVRVFERWRDNAALRTHFETEHMRAWRAAREALGFHDRRIAVFDVVAERPA